jgi:hypothetical protein
MKELQERELSEEDYDLLLELEEKSRFPTIPLGKLLSSAYQKYMADTDDDPELIEG